MRVVKVVSAVLVLVASAACGRATSVPTVPAASQAPKAPVAAAPPELAAGVTVYGSKCATCHGVNMEGTDTGPPFIHPFYVPSHHGDDSFVSAALNGVVAHHWQFGDMLPVEGITEPEVREVVAYVRWMQAQQGIR